MKVLLSAVVAVLLISLIPIAPTASAQAGPPLTQMEVTKITPSTVDGNSPEMTISGRLTNTSDQRISNLRGRAQSGSPLLGEGAIREAQRGDAETHTEPNFTPIADTLAPGQQAAFEIRVPINAGPNSLQINQPGVYPVLVNMNGQLDSGGRARVGTGQFMLPVTSVPGNPSGRPPAPTPTSMLLPLVDYPRMERDGTPGQDAILVDDTLSDSLAPGGRLFELLQAVDDSVGNGSQVGSGLCFAIDPDLLATVESMQNGYSVRQPDGNVAPGIGSQVARFWLTKLQAVTKGRCVIPLPYSDSDLVALGRANLPDLIEGSLEGKDLIQRLLGVEPRTDVVWPIDGTLDEPAAAELANLGMRTALMRPSAMSPPDNSLHLARLNTKGPAPDPLAVPTDPLLSSALDPQLSETGKSTVLSPPTGMGALTAENTLGTLAFRATLGAKPGGISLLAPPRRWNMRGDDLRTLLSGLQRLTDAGYIKPTSLPAPSAVSPPPPGSADPDVGKLPEARPAYPVTSLSDEIQRPVLNELAAGNYKVGDLFRSSERDPATFVNPADLTTPLRNGLLRGASSAWRAEPGASRYWLHKAEGALNDTTSRVWVDNPPNNIALSPSNSYLPVTITNKLPVTVSVTLRTPRQNGVTINNMGRLKIPAQGSRTFFVQTETTRPGKFTVDVNLHTWGGVYLGTRRFKLESTAYGPMSLILTATAAAALIVLSARRIIRRARRNRQQDTAGHAGESSATESTSDNQHSGGGTEEANATVTAPQSNTTEGGQNTS